MNIKEKMKAFDNKVINSKWAPRILGAVGTVSTFATMAASADGEVVAANTDTSALASTLSSSAMEAVTNGYTYAIPVITFALGISIVIRKIMGAARHC